MEFKNDHIAISVENLEESIKWYCSKLEFEVESKFVTGNGKIKAAYLKNGDVTIELLEHSEVKTMPMYRKDLMKDIEVVGVKHFAIKVDNLDETYEKLAKRGVEFTEKPFVGNSGKKIAFFRDLNEIVIELVERED